MSPLVSILAYGGYVDMNECLSCVLDGLVSISMKDMCIASWVGLQAYRETLMRLCWVELKMQTNVTT